MFCREQTVQVHRANSDLVDAGARVSIIGSGAPRFISDFREVTEYTGAIYTDPSRESFRALALVRGVRATFNLKSARQALRTLSNGYRQGRTRGDPWQQGGVLVIAPPSDILMVGRSLFAGDHIAMSEVVDLLRMRSVDDGWA